MIMTMLMMRINKRGCLTKRIPQAHTSMITTPRIMEEETGGGIDSRAHQVPMTVPQMKMKSKSILSI